MKTAYVDSSILVAIAFSEPQSSKYRRLLLDADEVVTSSLAEAELLSAASREKVEFSTMQSILDTVSLVFPDRSLFTECTRVLDAGHVRGADLHHLAVALYLDPATREMHFLTADTCQAKIAKKLGFKT